MNDMKWTIEFPARSGFYWVRNLVYRDPGLNSHPRAEVVDVCGGSCFYGAGNDVSMRKNEIVSAEWYGPIEPPE